MYLYSRWHKYLSVRDMALKTICQSAAILTKEDMTRLYMCLSSEDYLPPNSVARFISLLEAGVPFDSVLLFKAEDVSVLSALVKHGADINAIYDKKTPMEYALCTGKAKRYLDAGVPLFDLAQVWLYM